MKTDSRATRHGCEMVEIKFEIAFRTNSDEGSWKIIRQANLENIKLRVEDIRKVEPAYFAIPGDLYEERGVASPFHPCGGSIGIFVLGKDDIRRSIEEIFYYDYNVNQNHYDGKPHWNHEKRFSDGQRTWRIKNVEHHQIPDSPSIRIMIRDSKGNILKEKTVKRVSQREVRLSS